MILLSHPTGNANVREALKTLYSNNWLSAYSTTLGISNESLFFDLPLVGSFLRKKVAQRIYDLPSNLLRTNWLPEIYRLAKQKMPSSKKGSTQSDVDWLYQLNDVVTAKHLYQFLNQELKAVYAYEDGALETFRIARKKNLKCIYELPIAYWETSHHLLHEEALRYPKWEPTLVATQDSPQKCQRKTDELLEATHIICPSLFVEKSIPEKLRRGKSCTVIPYGAPKTDFIFKKSSNRKGHLRVLFVGSFTQRKGLADIFEAFKYIDPQKAQLTLLGSPILPLHFYRSIYPAFHFIPACAHFKVIQIMKEHDILVLPSIIEGRALVQLEALSCGLPVLITPNTGADSLVLDNENGFIVPIRSPQSIAEKINWLSVNRENLAHMKEKAHESAKNHSWEVYRKQLANYLKNVLE